MTALIAAVLLMASPVARACNEFGAESAGCAMRSAGASAMPCHEMADESMDCCGLCAAPEPVQAAGSASASLLAVPEASLVRAATLTPIRDRRPDPIGTSRLFDRGRYTLFSSYLL